MPEKWGYVNQDLTLGEARTLVAMILGTNPETVGAYVVIAYVNTDQYDRACNMVTSTDIAGTCQLIQDGMGAL